MNMTQFTGNESNWLKAKDIEGKSVRVVISEVGSVQFEAKNDKPAQHKATIKFKGKDKGVVLNSTNTKALIGAYGEESDNWIGKEIGLTTKDYETGPGIVVIILDVKYEADVPF